MKVSRWEGARVKNDEYCRCGNAAERFGSELKRAAKKQTSEKRNSEKSQRADLDGYQTGRTRRNKADSTRSHYNRNGVDNGRHYGRDVDRIEQIFQLIGDFVETRLPGGAAGDPSKATTDAGQPLRRLLPSRYEDGMSELAGADRPSARDISNAVSAATGDRPASSGISDLFWAWGQFLDHDIDRVPTGDESAPVSVPKGDAVFDPDGSGTETLPFKRSSGTDNIFGRRQQTNAITALIDASNVYGSDSETTAKLRSYEGGRMRMTDDGMLPSKDGFFEAGDVRANENPALTSLHTLFIREHNRIADNIAKRKPHLSDERIFEKARAKVTAEIQAITYNEFLPTLLGKDALGDYRGYTGIDAQISNSFATAAFRFGHSVVSDQLLLVDKDGAQKSIPLSEAFFNPSLLNNESIDSILRGLTVQKAQEFDTEIVDSLRNLVLDSPGSPRMDLASLNVQRGRDHGLPTLNEARTQLGLAPLTGFDDARLRDGVGDRLAAVYDSIDDVDLWVGMLAEKPVNDGLAGEVQAIVLADQFLRLRDGDPNWYENLYSQRKIDRLNNLTLADIIKRNTNVDNIQDKAMYAA